MEQTLRFHQKPYLCRQHRVQRIGRNYQHWASAHRITETVSRIPECGQLPNPSIQAQPDWQQFSLNPVMGRGPKHHGEDKIGGCGCHDQHPDRDVRVEHAAELRDSSACQHSQAQHRPCHCAGDAEEEQQHPQEAFFPAKGHQRQQCPRRQFYRPFRQEIPSWEKYRRRVDSAQQTRQQIPSPPGRDARQASRPQQQKIVHETIEQKHAVHIDNCHRSPPFTRCPLIIGQAFRKSRRKHVRAKRKRRASSTFGGASLDSINQ